MTTDDLIPRTSPTRPHRRWLMTAGTALAVLVTGFLPWFQSGWVASTNGVSSYETNSASAWAASTAWSMALVLNVTSAAASILLTRIDRHLPPALTSLRWAPPTLCLLGVVLVLWAWIEIPRADTIGAGGWSTSSGGHIGDIVHDRLQVLYLDGLRYDVGWGLYAGIFTMSSLCALLLLQAFHTHRHAT